MKNIIFVAPPAAGKGTQCELLVNKYGYHHLSTGDLLRNVDPSTEVGKKVHEVMSSGGLVDDELVFSLIKEHLLTLDYHKGVLFDGAIRTLKQVELYDQLCVDLNMDRGHVIFINISEERAMARSLGRLGCSSCGKIYHKVNMKPEVEGICDVCGGTLVSRDDDNEITFKNRFNTYLEKVEPVLDYYRNRNELITVEAMDNKMDTFAQIEEVLNND
ncbi:MAG: nucleoside monophosphate kinase [Mollicutes bacterium]|jgi:adenylate kinase|nr:nucleoside monophosphate kinase [Mollicutes bacterium]